MWSILINRTLLAQLPNPHAGLVISVLAKCRLMNLHSSWGKHTLQSFSSIMSLTTPQGLVACCYSMEIGDKHCESTCMLPLK